MPQEPLLEIAGIEKSFGGQRILKGISLEVRAGEFLTLLGPSGCGKTTTLRIIAGFERPDRGTVSLGGVDVTSWPPDRRNVHTVFQHYALFPHYDVFENVAFSLRLKRVPDPELGRRVREALALVKLSGFERRRVSQLSGGQQQRIALARSMVGRPGLLLLDEPLGALDLKLRRAMQLELKQIQKATGIAFVYVTHDQEEALTLSDRIAVFDAGSIVQLGPPKDIYETPRTSFVADFIGSANLLDASVSSVDDGAARLVIEGEVEATVPVPADEAGLAAGDLVTVAIRPEAFEVRFAEPAGSPGRLLRWPAVLEELVYLGASTHLHLAPFGPGRRRVVAATFDPVERVLGDGSGAGRRAWLELDPADVLILEKRC